MHLILNKNAFCIQAIILLGVLAFLPASYAKTENPGVLPQSWYLHPEDGGPNEAIFSASDSKMEERLGLMLENLFQTNQDALEKLPITQETPPALSLATPPDHPSNWTPWNLTYITSELAITLQGLVGIVSVRRMTPAIVAWWRRQGPPPSPSPGPTPQALPPPQLGDSQETNVIEFSESSDPASIEEQTEPFIQAALASGKVRDADALRKNLRNSAKDLGSFLDALDSNPKLPWWPSRFRFDFLVDVQGNILPAFVAGGDIKFRFDWRRVRRRTTPYKNKLQHQASLDRFKLSLGQFVTIMQHILANATLASPSSHGFEPFTFRVGLGITANLQVGIIRGTSTAIGHIFFSQDVSKPIVYPPPEAPKLALRDQPILILESKPPESHLLYAKKNHLLYEVSPDILNHSTTQAAYRAPQESVLRGIKKALKIGDFFARKSAKAKRGKWKVHTMYVGYDYSITGDAGLVSAGLSLSSLIAFYNKDF